MKNQYVIFYSWMSDRPDSQNRKYIQKILKKDAKRIEKELGIAITIDSDSRGEDGSTSIEETILQKISSCDLFVGDITPVSPRFSILRKNKLIVNSNVMYELGYAVSTLGWNRCIMIWNSKYGNLSYSPFDIRNHPTINYHSDKNDLSLYDVLKSKIENYDEYVKTWRTAKERSFDIEKYGAITQICSERDLVDSINNFLTTRSYNKLELDWWINLIHQYNNYPDNRFFDEEIHQEYSAFLTELQKMVTIACLHNERIPYCNKVKMKVGTDEWKRIQLYKIRDPYDTLPEQRAYQLQMKIENDFNGIIPTLMNSYTSFRNLIRSKLLV